jgi:hypothetical protein
MGAFAEGAGIYNKKTAVAESINADTVMRWNAYLYESQQNANRLQRQRMTQRKDRTVRARDEIQKRLRDNPEQRDIFQGDALNVALDEINDPRVYTQALQAAKAKVGGDHIRDIPFQYAAAAITVSIHELAKGPLPSALLTPEFQADRAALKDLDRQIVAQLEGGGDPDPATIKKLLGIIYAAEEKATKTLPRNSRERNDAVRYLKALHGLVAMLDTPAINLILAGVEKRPNATLGDLLAFMNAFNLRFGAASTTRQREVYTALYPQLVALRNQVVPALAAAGHKVSDAAAVDFFAPMSLEDLEKEAPKP